MPKPKAKADKVEEGKVTSQEPEKAAEPAAEDQDSATVEDEKSDDLKVRLSLPHLRSRLGQPPSCKLALYGITEDLGRRCLLDSYNTVIAGSPPITLEVEECHCIYLL